VNREEEVQENLMLYVVDHLMLVLVVGFADCFDVADTLAHIHFITIMAILMNPQFQTCA
jgi:hypothetical protein